MFCCCAVLCRGLALVLPGRALCGRARWHAGVGCFTRGVVWLNIWRAVFGIFSPRVFPWACPSLCEGVCALWFVLGVSSLPLLWRERALVCPVFGVLMPELFVGDLVPPKVVGVPEPLLGFWCPQRWWGCLSPCLLLVPLTCPHETSSQRRVRVLGVSILFCNCRGCLARGLFRSGALRGLAFCVSTLLVFSFFLEMLFVFLVLFFGTQFHYTSGWGRHLYLFLTIC